MGEKKNLIIFFYKITDENKKNLPHNVRKIVFESRKTNF